MHVPGYHQHVHMIRHYTPTPQRIPNAIEVKQSILDDVGGSASKQTLARSPVQVSLTPLEAFTCIDGSLRLVRKRVGETEDHVLGRARAIVVWQISTSAPARMNHDAKRG